MFSRKHVIRTAIALGIALCFLIVVLLVGLLFFRNHAPRFDAESEILTDGIFTGLGVNFPNIAMVVVTVQSNTVQSVEIKRHFASWHGKKAEGKIPGRVLKHQSTGVDAVTSATSSSVAILNAVRKALLKSCQARGGG